MKKKKVLIIIVLLLLLSIIALFFLFRQSADKPLLSVDTNATDWKGKQNLQHAKSMENSIAIPGFDTLVFTAGQTNQKVNFFNPEQNTCLFKMKLYIDDTLFWESGYIESGKGYYDIQLLEPLESGEYKGSLLVNCFKEDGTALNSASVECTIISEE